MYNLKFIIHRYVVMTLFYCQDDYRKRETFQSYKSIELSENWTFEKNTDERILFNNKKYKVKVTVTNKLIIYIQYIEMTRGSKLPDDITTKEQLGNILRQLETEEMKKKILEYKNPE